MQQKPEKRKKSRAGNIADPDTLRSIPVTSDAQDGENTKKKRKRAAEVVAGSQPSTEEHTSIPLADVDPSIRKKKKKSNKTLEPASPEAIKTTESAIELKKKKKNNNKDGEAGATDTPSTPNHHAPSGRPKRREKNKLEHSLPKKSKIVSADPSLPDPSEDTDSNLSDQARKGA